MADSIRAYDATVIRWVDGDTVWLRVDLGFRISVDLDFRLYGIDTPERGQPGYREATMFNMDHAPAGSSLVAVTRPDPEKYGRWLAELTVTGTGTTLNQMLLDAKLAVPYFGGKK